MVRHYSKLIYTNSKLISAYFIKQANDSYIQKSNNNKFKRFIIHEKFSPIFCKNKLKTNWPGSSPNNSAFSLVSPI